MATTISPTALHSAPKTPSTRVSAIRPDRAIWHAAAPQTVRDATDWMTGSDGWNAWAAHLAQRRTPCPLGDLLPGKATLLWGVAADRDGDAGSREGHARGTAELIVRLDRLSRKKRFDDLGTLAAELATWLSESGVDRSINRALECLAWARALPRLAATVPAGIWWKLLGELLHVVDDAHDAVETDPLLRQLLGVELPLSLAHLFPEIQPCRDLACGAAAAWERGIVVLADKDGFVKQRNMSLVRPLLACWTRVMSVIKQFADVPVSPTVNETYRRFVRQALRFSRRDGSTALTTARPSAYDRALFLAAVAAGEAATDTDSADTDSVDGGDGEAGADRLIAQSIFSDRRLAKKRLHFGGPLPTPAAHSEGAGLAVLRPDWSRGSARLWVAYGGSEVRVELACGRDRLLSGNWTTEIHLGGRLLTPRGNWEEVCWVSDEDVDYLELEISLSEHVRLERQILLARKDGLLFLADAVLGGESDAPNGNGNVPDGDALGLAGGIEYRGTLPLANEMAFDAAGESREGYLVGRKPRAIVFPLALPEWRSEACGGSLETTAAGLELRQSRATARRLYVPLLFDLDARRILQPATWRTLTVAENRTIQPANVAVGYRAQMGKEQWMFYRSLAERGNRTLLGQNLASEFLAARFNRSGETDPLLEIE